MPRWSTGSVRRRSSSTTPGSQGFDPFLTITPEKWQRILDVNLTGTFHCCQVVLPHMVDAGWGRIVNISSSSAQGGQPLMTHYVSSKAGVIGLTKALALEFGPKGITVNTIPPGFIDTPMLRDSEQKGLFGEGVELPCSPDAGATDRPTRRHRRSVRVPRQRRSLVCHGSGDRCQRRTQHLIALRCHDFLRSLPTNGPRRWATRWPRYDPPRRGIPFRRATRRARRG